MTCTKRAISFFYTLRTVGLHSFLL